MRKLLPGLLAAALLAGFAAAPSAEAPRFDLLIQGGRVVDGTGAPYFVADVGVIGGRIAAVGRLSGSAKRVLDASGLVVAPGFIDLLGQSEYNVLVDPRVASKVTQGITSEVTGEGDSIAPLTDALIAENADVYKKYGVTPDWKSLDAYFATFSRRGAGINLGTFVGSGSVRAIVIGRENRKAAPEELARMEGIVEEAMREGALGVSSSLQYIPNIYSST
ncbi:MAG TPA: D-aminoacylase, partial [Thermoanaerobaculia bacterium]|nr:D-aminoacylase [Thermoanaerobaculia bacterium]